jgi:hypothetical protein
MSTDLRNVPNLDVTNKLTQTRFWGGAERKQCVQVTQRNHEYGKCAGAERFSFLQLTRDQAKALAVELMLFAEGCEVEAEEM